MEIKTCTGKCGRELPATLEFFYEQKGGKFGLRGKCKECYNKCQKEYQKEYRKTEKYRKLKREAQKKYAHSKKGKIVDLKFKIKNRLSRAVSESIRRSLNGNKNGHHWEDIVGYTLQDLKDHLESLFQEGMTWENHGQW
ncbi:MAG: hypothetical protein V3W20_14755, partial [Candidatus Neomarinimicrobiota bacterium]